MTSPNDAGDPIAAVARFLARRPEGAPPGEIARDVLRLWQGFSGSAATAASVIRRLLLADARFVERDGLWHLAGHGAGAAFVAEPGPDAGSHAGSPRREAPAAAPPSRDDLLAVACEPAPGRSISLVRLIGGRVRFACHTVDPERWAEVARALTESPEPEVVVGLDARSLRAVRDIAPGVPRESVRGLAARVLPRVPRTLEALADSLDLALPYADAGPEAHARLVGEAYRALRARSSEVRGGEPARAGSAAWNEEAARAAASAADRLLPPAARHRLPSAPGVYVFRARNGRPLYVGKAKNLRRRLLAHFTRAAAERERALHEATARVTFEVLGSEVEALLRELALIVRHAPAWNRQRAVSRDRGVGPRDVLLFLPTVSPSRVRVYAVRRDGAVLESVLDRAGRRRRARDEIAAFYFDGGSRQARARPRRAGRAAGGRLDPGRLALLLSWYRANRDRVTGMQPSALADRADFLRVLGQHLADPDLLVQRSERI